MRKSKAGKRVVFFVPRKLIKTSQLRETSSLVGNMLDVNIQPNYTFLMHIRGFQKSPGDTKIDAIPGPQIRRRKKKEISFCHGSKCSWKPHNSKSSALRTSSAFSGNNYVSCGFDLPASSRFLFCVPTFKHSDLCINCLLIAPKRIILFVCVQQ